VRAYERELKVNKKEGRNYSGYQIRVEGEKSHIFSRNFIIPLDDQYLIKEGHSIENSKEIGIAVTPEEANKKAYKHINGSPLSRLKNMMDKAGLEKIIHDKNRVYIIPKFASVN